jgi:hypothetical protein
MIEKVIAEFGINPGSLMPEVISPGCKTKKPVLPFRSYSQK